MLSIRLAPRAVTAISDLSLLILRNYTQVPFIMGDAPCVFSNRYMRDIRDSGVLSLMTRGLMAVLPIDPHTQVLLYDAAVYTPEYSTAGCIDVFRIADVSLLNALQIYSAEENVYFADVSSETYLRELLSAHRRHLQDHRGRFVIHGPGKILVTGVPNTDEVLHVFEPQLPLTLDLSFISTSPLPSNQNPNHPRDLTLALQMYQGLGMPNEASPIGMNEFAGWIESQLSVSGET